MKLRNFSSKTVKSYSYYITEVLVFANKNFKEITTKDIRNYLEKLTDRDVSVLTLNGAYIALKFYFEKILRGKFLLINVPRAKSSKNCPKFLLRVK